MTTWSVTGLNGQKHYRCRGVGGFWESFGKGSVPNKTTTIMSFLETNEGPQLQE